MKPIFGSEPNSILLFIANSSGNDLGVICALFLF